MTLLVVLSAFLSSVPAQESEPPNIVFLYADDLGYGDLACYGSPAARTPRLDALSREGTRFTQFYVSHCVCSPTRCSAITGRFPSRYRIFGHIAFLASNRRRRMPDWLDVNAPSLPRALQRAGYRTAMIGKWHLGGGSGSTWRSDHVVINHPDAPAVARYGFDHVRATFGNSATWRHAEPWPEPHDIYPYDDEEWATWSSRAIADETIAFLNDHATGPETRNRPFYVNVWFKDVHVPLRPTADMRRPFPDLDDKSRTHYAMVRYMDEQIGRILDALDELGLRENTLVLFSSDNGAGKNRGGSNGPLREWKHFLYEGGIRVPLIVRWPGEVPAGRTDTESVLNIVDFVPTIAALAGARMPDGYVSDGENISDAFRGRPFRRSRQQYWLYPGAAENSPTLAVRDGDWKLLTDPDGVRIELYDLGSDVSETTNRAEQHPVVAAALKEELLNWYGQQPLTAN
jgi:N-acetylgalactosamine-6-sulfatase